MSRWFHRLALAGLLGTLLLVSLWAGWLFPPRRLPPAAVVLAVGLPLLLPLRGMLHGRRYTCAWSLFLSLPYFIHGTVEAWADPAARPLALLEVATTLAWIIGATGYVRLTRA